MTQMYRCTHDTATDIHAQHRYRHAHMTEIQAYTHNTYTDIHDTDIHTHNDTDTDTQ